MFKKHVCALVLLLIFPSFMWGNLSFIVQDTIAPEIETLPSDLVVPCGETYQIQFNNWLLNAGGLTVTDSGTAVLFSTFNMVNIEEEVSSSSDTLCSNTAFIPVGFYAIDDCNNSSDTVFANFIIEDNTPPVITLPIQNVFLECGPSVQDSLVNWLNNQGGAQAQDECGGDVVWNNYVWNDNLGNDGFANIGDSTDIVILPTDCDRTINFSFFVLDECSNANVTTGTFIIQDTQNPVVENFITDTIITCIDTLPDLTPQFIDDCGGDLDIQIESNSTQGMSADDCSFYNYGVNNSYTVTDACGNSITLDQSVQVLDTVAPIIIADENVFIDCDADLSLSANFLDSLIDCSPIAVSFEDLSINVGPCSSNFTRTWSFSDVCGNMSSLVQNVFVIDQDGPELEGQIPSLTMDCEELESFNDQIRTFIQEIKTVAIIDDCNEGTASILNAESPDGASFDFQYVPNLGCEGNNLLQQENISITLEDSCNNTSSAASTISILDTIKPTFLSCPKELSFDLEMGTCSLDYELVEYTVDIGCDSILLPYYFQQEYLLKDIDSTNLPNLIFQWDYEENTSTQINGEVEVNVEFSSILNENLDLVFDILDGAGEIIYSYDNSVNTCEAQSINFIVSDSLANLWLEDGLITLNVDFKIDDFADCQMTPFIGINILIPTTFTSSPKFFFSLNEEEEKSFSSGDILNLSAGQHTLIYIAEDCGGNRDSCIQIIDVLDLDEPSLECPDDLTINLTGDSCTIDYLINPDFQFIENCMTELNNEFQLPMSSERFLEFTELDDGSILASNIQLVYENIELEGLILNPVLIIEILANTDGQNAFFSIRDENGNDLGVTPQNVNSCIEPQIVQIDLSLTELQEWNQDGEIEINFIQENAANGITPCDTTNFDGQIDQSSFLTATLAYTEVNPTVTILNLDSNDTIKLENQIGSFEPGVYDIELKNSDSSGNQASCNYSLTVLDEIAPIINCEDSDFEISVEDENDLNIDSDSFEFMASDNCDSVVVELDLATLSCEDIGESINSVVTVTDKYGNSSSCDFIITVQAAALEPSFSSSLCGGDTLSLFNNITPLSGSNLTYDWTGPNNFESSEENPDIVGLSNANSGLYTLEVTNELGCSFIGTVDVIIETLDSPVLSVDDDMICEGETLTLNSNPFSDQVTYIWFEGISPNEILLGQTDVPSFEITPTNGPHSYFAIVEGSGCQSNPSSVLEIEVIPEPTALVQDNFITICESESILLETANTNPTLEFSWTGPNGYSSSEANPPEIMNATLSMAGMYELVVSDRGCASPPATVEVIIFPQPVTPIISGQNIKCQGNEFNLTVSNNVSAEKYNWYLNGELHSITNTNTLIIVPATQALSGEWTVILEEGNCESEVSAGFLVEIESQITIGASNDGPSCIGEFVTLTASFIPNGNYVWTTPNNQQFFDRIVTVPAVQGIYTVMVTTPSGCEGTATTVVDIIDVPTITALSNSAANCMNIGDEISFSPTIFPPGNYNYFWSGPNGFSSTAQDLIINYLGQNSNGTYTLQVQINGCLSEVASTSINSTIIPNAPIIDLQQSACEGSEINILVSNVTNEVDTYFWTTPLGQITTNDPILSIPNANNTNSGAYSLTVEANGCISEPSETISITVNPTPDVPTIVGTNELCAGQILELNPENPQVGVSYSWSTPEGNVTDTETLIIDPFSAASAGSYFLQADIDGCISDFSEAFVVSIITGPEAPELNPNEFRFCENELEQVDLVDFIQNDPMLEYVLYNDEGFVLASSLDGNFTGLNLSDLDPGFYIFQVAASLNGCESESPSNLTIIVEEVPAQAVFVSEDLELCQLSIEQIFIDIPNQVETSIEVIGSNMEIQSQINNSIILNIFDFGEGSLVLTSSNEVCGDFGTDTLNILVQEEVIANDDLYTVTGNDQTTLDILENDEFEGEVQVSISTLPDNPPLVFTNGVAILDPSELDGTFIYTYEICSENCPDICDQATIEIDLDNQTPGGGGVAGCLPPAVITPNGDGINDDFIIPCLIASDVIELKIFSASGSSVFESDNYQNDWDGLYDGELLPVGTYYYTFKKNNETPETGFIIIEL